ncbi:MAG: ABC transporter substrate-binding protein [Nocardioides sp.]|uniref:ABC transporter substrate-binding protein n=1 Tax=Nocardioides sp. TaxID=35761 RepID=UPI0039E2A604
MSKFLKRGGVTLAAVALATTALTACGSSDSSDGGGTDDSSSGTKGGELTYLLATPIGHLDPQRIYVGRDIINVKRTVYRTWLAYGLGEDASDPIPDIATDTGTVSEDAKTWSFTVRDGVTWQDGSDVTCEDFAYGFSRNFASDVITGGPSNYPISYLDLGGVKYPGPYTATADQQAAYDKAVSCDGNTITYHFKNPWPDFGQAVASLNFADPYKKDQDQGDKSNFSIFSNGPYKLDGTWDENTGGTLVRNTEYDASSDPTDARGALPDTIKFSIGTEPEAIIDEIANGASEGETAVTGTRIQPQQLATVKSTASDRYKQVTSPYYDYLWLNVKRLDLPVRQAILAATNDDAWITAGGGKDFYQPVDSIIPTTLGAYKKNESFADLGAGDTDKAKQILTDAGVTMPYPLTFTFDGSSETGKNQAAALKDTFDQAGFKVTLNPLTDAYYPTIQDPESKTDIGWAGWGADWPSALTILPPLFDGSVNLIDPASNQNDYGNYNSDEFNALVAKAQAATTTDEQDDLMSQADALLGKDVAYIPLENSLFNWTWGPKVTGFTTTFASNGFPDLGAIGVKQ